MYWSCGQCCVYGWWDHVQLKCLKLAYWTCGQCCVFHIWVVGYNIAIGPCIMDMWSVLCVPNVGGGI